RSSSKALAGSLTARGASRSHLRPGFASGPLGWSGEDEALWMMGEDRTNFQYFGIDQGYPNNPISPAGVLRGVDVSSDGTVAFMGGGLLSVDFPDTRSSILANVSSAYGHLDLAPDGSAVLATNRSQEVGEGIFEVLVIRTSPVDFETLRFSGNTFYQPKLVGDDFLMYGTRQLGFVSRNEFTNIRLAPFNFSVLSRSLFSATFLSPMEENTPSLYFDWKP
ncbi:MAG: hypothetical protein AAF399_29225, partial [Bacteroidota bacterium]